jgi:hypothetical protein
LYLKIAGKSWSRSKLKPPVFAHVALHQRGHTSIGRGLSKENGDSGEMMPPETNEVAKNVATADPIKVVNMAS